MSAEKRGVLGELPHQEAPEQAFGSVIGVFHPLGDGPDGLSLRLSGLVARGLSALSTEVQVRRDELRAVPTSGARRIRAVLVGVGDARLGEDGLVVLLPGDVLVGLPHVRVDAPVDSVLDFAPVVSLAAHSRHRRVPEVVRVDWLVDTASVRGVSQLFADRRRRERAVVVFLPLVPVTGELVKEGDVRLVRPRVRGSEVGAQRRFGVDDRVRLDGRPLQSLCVRVRRVRRPVALEVDVADAERASEGESGPGVCQELDQGNVADIHCPVAEGCDIITFEHVPRLDFRVGLSRRGVVLGPLGEVHRLQEVTDGVFDVPDRRIGQSGFVSLAVLQGVAQIVHVGVHVSLGQLGDGLAEALAGETEVLQVLGHRPVGHVAVDLLDVALDVGQVRLVVAVNPTQFALESVAKTGEVVEVRHTNCCHEVHLCKTGPVKEISFELYSSTKVGTAKSSQPDASPFTPDGQIASGAPSEQGVVA